MCVACLCVPVFLCVSVALCYGTCGCRAFVGLMVGLGLPSIRARPAALGGVAVQCAPAWLFKQEEYENGVLEYIAHYDIKENRRPTKIEKYKRDGSS